MSAQRKFRRAAVRRGTLTEGQQQELLEIAKNTPIKHPPFNEEMRADMRKLKAALDEVYPQTLEEWEIGFRKDTDFQQEIAFWLHLAERYTAETEGKPLTLAEKKAIYLRLLGTQTVVLLKPPDQFFKSR